MAWGVVVDVAEAVQGVRLAIGVVVVAVQGEGGLAVFAGGVVVAEAGGVPAHRVERVGFPHWVVEAALEVQGAAGVVQGLLYVPLAVTALFGPGMTELFGPTLVRHAGLA